MTSKKLIKLLQENGFEIVKGRGKGSHTFLYNPITQKVTTVPHENGDISKGTLADIKKQTGLQ